MTHRADTLMRLGPKCLRGHVGMRYVSSGRCVECTAADARVKWQLLRQAQRAARARAIRLGAGRG